MPDNADRLDLFVFFLQLLSEEEQDELLTLLEAEERLLESQTAGGEHEQIDNSRSGNSG